LTCERTIESLLVVSGIQPCWSAKFFWWR